MLARDVGLDALTSEEGLEDLLQKMKAFVFPRANEEAKELFRAGQKHGGPLSRQSGESMLSYTNRRKRWWSVLQELDSTMMLSDSLRAELLLELSGLSRQEILVTKACANPKNFEGYCKVLVDHTQEFTSEKVARHGKAALHL